MSKAAWLVGTRPDGKPSRWPLEKEDVTIGRKAPADLILSFPHISRLHAKITRTPKGYFLEDLGSRNGTFVNGNPVGRRPHRLFGGDEIVLGEVTTLRFDDPDETATGPIIGRLKGVWINSGTRSVWVDAHLINPPLSQAQFT
ncbi:MAG: FHA domain-containing protein, partial [Anaerolineales bacterium]